jgi:hypothetical protein
VLEKTCHSEGDVDVISEEKVSGEQPAEPVIARIQITDRKHPAMHS